MSRKFYPGDFYSFSLSFPGVSPADPFVLHSIHMTKTTIGNMI
jgi:hypothetical protein